MGKSSGEIAGAIGGLSFVCPMGTRENATSRLGSTLNNAFTCESTKSATILAESFEAADIASRLARIVPLSHPKWR